MSMQEFINSNRQELIECIYRVAPGVSVSDGDIEDWINNDEGLYNWALSEGVEV